MHLYCLGILLTIPSDCYMISCLFQRDFFFFSSGIYLYLVLLQGFRFLQPVKELRIHLRQPENFRCSLYTYINMYCYFQGHVKIVKIYMVKFKMYQFYIGLK